MSQLYARVFLQILDSSIAEDFTARHVFEDFLKLSEDGIVDMTRQALGRRINCPSETLNRCIAKLESPDPNSRDQDFEGRRIERLDQHRDWGWRILNWEKYDSMRTRADVALRVARHRKKTKTETNQVSGSSITAEQIYEAYPRKVGRGAALKKIEVAMRKVTPEELLKAASGFSEAWKGESDLQYCPHPATWFGQERYLDSPSTWQRTEASAENGQPQKTDDSIWDRTPVIHAKK